MPKDDIGGARRNVARTKALQAQLELEAEAGSKASAVKRATKAESEVKRLSGLLDELRAATESVQAEHSAAMKAVRAASKVRVAALRDATW